MSMQIAARQLDAKPARLRRRRIMTEVNSALVSRRALIGSGIALGTAFIVGVGVKPMLANADAVENTQYGFLVHPDNCVKCERCVDACRRANKTPADVEARRQVVSYTSSFNKTLNVSLGCMHCEDPACARVCPAGAISKRDDGIVAVDTDRCIGCKYCHEACPFGIPHYDEAGMDKCDCCLEAGVPAGEEPNCAAACMFNALEFGKIDELEAKCHGTARRIEADTNPAYLLAW